MICSKCNAKLDDKDNFCYKCGNWTSNAYTYFKDEHNKEILTKGIVVKQNSKILRLFILIILSSICFIIFTYIKGMDMFKPVIYIENKIYEKIYGYKTTSIKTNNKYPNETIDTYEEALSFIKNDFDKQHFKCFTSDEVSRLEYNLEQNLNIQSVMFCGINLDLALSLTNTIESIYNEYNIKGILTNISLSNSKDKEKYLASFTPKNELVKNKVYKTEILLNSYYFLNDDILKSKDIGSYYVKDASWESVIAHELGHAVSFKTVLNKYNVESITYGLDTYMLNNIMDTYLSGDNSKEIFFESYNLFINEVNDETIDDYLNNISLYAKDKSSGDYIYEEAIAEAIHDVYLHKDNASKESLYIVKVVKERL